jgi:sugar O-acyltransferase (sialic acid O-acetyltransferase NeuD family)
MKRLLIIGAGGHGGAVADAAARTGQWSGIEFYDDRVPTGSEAYGFRVQGKVDALFARIESGGATDVDTFVAVGDNMRRLLLARRILATQAPLATIIHPAATVGARVEIGAGTVLMAGAVINIASRLGIACIVNTRAGVDHECLIGDAVHVCPGVSLAGRVHIGDLAWIGIGSSVIQGRRIGTRSTVGAGSVVIRDIEDGVTVVGNPARVLRND